MVRTLISLHEKDKKWLEHYSRMNHMSVSEVIRIAINNFIEGSRTTTRNSLLRDTAGMWKDRTIDGIDYVKKLREEW
jgi:hypothetical protein